MPMMMSECNLLTTAADLSLCCSNVSECLPKWWFWFHLMIHQLRTFHLLVALGAAHLITSKFAELHRCAVLCLCVVYVFYFFTL